MKKLLFIMIFFLVMNTAAKAQPGGLGGIAYSMGQTVWDTNDFIDDFSWRGVSFEFKHFASDQLAYGFQLGWSVFGQRVDDVAVFDQGAISGTQIRKLGALPILVSLNYHAASLYSDVSPYLTLNLGTYYMIEQMSMGIYAAEASAWHFGVAPELGVYLPAGDGYLQIAVKLNKAFAAGDYLGGGSKEFTWLSLNVGVAFPTF